MNNSEIEDDPPDDATLDTQMEPCSMAGNTLCSWSIIRKGEVPKERTDCHSKHDHPIVSHEKKPIPGQQSIQRCSLRDTHMIKKL